MRQRESDHPAERWGRRVLAGEIVTGPLVRKCIERHFADRETGAERGLICDPAAGQHVLDFFHFLRHSKGEWFGQTFHLADWQAFLLFVLFSWKRADGTRRFRMAYIEVARKNGKSTLAAGVGLFLFVADEEPGAEVYCAATKRDQAKIVWSEADRMVKASPSLRKRVQSFKDNLNIPGTHAKFEPLGADEDTLDGLNIHGAIIDELHAHKTRGVHDVIVTATGARRQSLIFEITTAGYDRESVCWEQHEYANKVLDGVIVDDSFFAFIAALDPGDIWTDPRVWIKANPNLGISVKLDSLQEQIEKAKNNPAEQYAIRRLRLNEWTQNEIKWIPLEVWDRGAGDIDEKTLEGRLCYGGLDLASSIDIAAWVLAFPPTDEAGPIVLLPRFWIPKENIHARALRDRVPYDAWVRDGWIFETEGNVIDYKAIRQQIVADYARFAIRQVRFDRWGATQLTTELAEEDGLEMVQMGQGYASMSAPSKEFMKLLLEGRVIHAGHPVLRWMADNVMVKMDPAGNIKPDREKSREKIDGIVAAVMCIDGIMRQPRSVYEESGIKTI